MPDQTDRHDLYTYSHGERWRTRDGSLPGHNDVVELVDELSIDHGPFGDRPSTGDYDGEKFFATDRRILYAWDDSGASWDAVGGAGTSSEPLPEQYVADLNGTRFIDASEGASTVETAVGNYDEVIVYGSAEWTETVQVPSNTHLRFADGAEITVPSSHNLTLEGPADDTSESSYSLVRNDDWSNGDENVEIEGGHFDLSAVSETDNVFALFLSNATSSHIKGAEVVGGTGDTFGVGAALHDCTDSELIDCICRDWSYEGLGVLGCDGCKVIGCEGHDNGNHAIQLHPSLHSQRDTSVNCTVRDCVGTPADDRAGKIVYHGKRTVQDPEGNVIKDCKASEYDVIEEFDDFVIRDCAATITDGPPVRVFSQGTSGPWSLRGLTVDNLSAEITTTDALVRLRARATDVTIEDVHIKNCDVNAGFLVRPFNNDVSTDNPTYRDIRVSDCTLRSGGQNQKHIVRVYGTNVESVWLDGIHADADEDMARVNGDETVDFYSVENCDLRDVTSETNGDGFSTTTNRENNLT